MADNYDVLTGDNTPTLISIRAKNNSGVLYTPYVGSDDGAIVTAGTTTDAPATTADTTSWSLIALIKGIFSAFLSLLGVGGTPGSKAISIQGIGSGTAVPVSSATLATAANQATIIGNMGGLASVTLQSQGVTYLETIAAAAGTIGSPGTNILSTQGGFQSVVLQNAASSNVTGTTLNVAGLSAITVLITSNSSAAMTLSFQASVNGTTYLPQSGRQVGGANPINWSSIVITPNQTLEFIFSVAGWETFQVPITNYSAGTVTVTANGTSAQYTHSTVTARTNCTRNGGILHRSTITAIDKLATMGTITLTGQATGSLTSGTTYYVMASAYNRWGNALPGTQASAAPGGSNGTLRAAFSAITGADGYDIFLGATTGAPLWVGRITEAQRASGIVISAAGTYTAGGATNSVDIQVIGIGLAGNALPFTNNNAYTPATPTPINCGGYSLAHVLVKLAITDLRSLPTLAIVPFLNNQLSTADWHQGQLQTVGLLTSLGQALEQDFYLEIDGSTNLTILIDTISGQGASASIWVELM